MQYFSQTTLSLITTAGEMRDSGGYSFPDKERDCAGHDMSDVEKREIFQ